MIANFESKARKKSKLKNETTPQNQNQNINWTKIKIMSVLHANTIRFRMIPLKSWRKPNKKKSLLMACILLCMNLPMLLEATKKVIDESISFENI